MDVKNFCDKMVIKLNGIQKKEIGYILSMEGIKIKKHI